MRAALVVVVAVAAVGCGSDMRASKLGAQTSHQATGEAVAYIDMERPEKLVKHFPVEPDPANDAQDRVSCRNAGGDWADSYVLGVLTLREPHEGAVLAGKTCWSNRRPTKLADAGKLCNGQEDCIGNCVAEKIDAKWSAPRCQTYAEESICGPIYDAGRYHWINCPVP